MNLKVL